MNAQGEADVLIVGGGLAGLTVGGRAILGGLSAVILEKGEDEDYLCNSRIATGAFSLAHCDPTSDPSFLRDSIFGDTEGYADPALAAAVASVAGEAMQWLRSEGAKFIRVQALDNQSKWSMAPPRPAKPGSLLVRDTWKGRGPDHVLRCLMKNFKDRGGRFHLGIRAQRLLFELGRCVGVEAIHKGQLIVFRARNVVIADGGFQANPGLVRRFIGPRPEQFTQRNARTGMGDGLVMAEEAGACLTACDRFYGHLQVQESATNDTLWPYPTLDSLSSSAIVIDRSGRRFLDEGIGGVPMANAIAQLKDPLCATTIFDQPLWETVGRLEHIPPNPLLVEYGGTVSSANTLEQLAVMIDVPASTLAETVQNYNAAIAGGDLDKLDPLRTPGRMFGTLRSLPQRLAVAAVAKPPFYAVRLCPGITYTMGGIAIDERAQVLDKSGEPMPGLFAAGSCTGGLEGGPMSGYIGGLNKALALGFIAARSIRADEHGSRSNSR
jgi:fumarate reductase flavoprotein subunit